MMWPNVATGLCVVWAVLCAVTIRPVLPCFGMVILGAAIITLAMA